MKKLVMAVIPLAFFACNCYESCDPCPDESPRCASMRRAHEFKDADCCDPCEKNECAPKKRCCD